MSRLIAVGVGPGDPELITVKGARLIGAADIIITPAAVPGGDSVARSIVAGLIDPDRQLVVTRVFPMRREGEGLEAIWEQAAREMADWIRAGKTVVFVTLGDPCLYSTFLYVYRHLRQLHPEIPVEIVSGVSSLSAAAALADLPLALGEEKLAIIPATYAEDELARTLEAFDTIVLMKVSRVFERVRQLLTSLGLKERAVYVRRAGLPGEGIWHDLDAVAAEDLDYLSLVIVKK